VGLSTNVQFLRHVVGSRSFAEADLDTALIPREQAVLFKQERIGLSAAAAAAVALCVLEEKALETNDPFSKRDGWRSHGVTLRRFEFEFHGEPAKAELTYLHDGDLHLAVGGREGLLVFSQEGQVVTLTFGGQRLTVRLYRHDETVFVFGRQGATQITVVDRLAHAGEAHGEAGRLTAPMPGKVVSFAVKAGDNVSKGQALAVMEAMKMEHTIAAPADGVVQELLYAPGDQVPEGAELLKMAG